MYPVPAYAATIWVSGDNLMVTFPPQKGERSHTISLPISEGGLKTAVQIFRDRAHASDLRIANVGTPTQYQVESAAKYRAFYKPKPKRLPVPRRKKIKDLLKELEL